MDLRSSRAMKYSISRRIITAFSILIILFVVSLLFVFHGLVKDAHINVALEELRDKTVFVENYLQAKYGTKTLSGDVLRDEVVQVSGITNLRVTFIDHEGRVLADSDVDDPSNMDNHAYRAEIMQARDDGDGHSMRYSDTIQTGMFYYARRYDDYYLRMAKPLVEMRAHLIQIKQIMIYLGIVVLLISIVVVYYITASITRPINETISFASQFASGNYLKRITDYSNSEIGLIQRSLNNMADELVEKMNTLMFEQNKLKITIESIDDGIAVIDSEKRIIIVNKAFYRCMDISEMTATGLLYFEIIRNRSLNYRIEHALVHAKSEHFEEEFVGGRIYDIHINPIREEKTLQGVLLVLREITEKKKIEKMKTDLVGNMSHELKTPVTIIKGYLETIANNINDPALCSGFITKAIENADRQTSIINDIIKLNMIETSGEFQKEKVILDDVLTGCVNILEHKAQHKGVRITTNLGLERRSVSCNKFLIEEIFFNLIDNAINYNREDGTVFIESYRKGKGGIVIHVHDTGYGIPTDSVERIFERFYRVDKSRSRETGGTGLGLSIVKHAVLLLGWQISVESDDSGSTFTVLI